jgi:hypothetical protein
MIGDLALNNSKVSLLQRCGEAFRRQEIEGEEMPNTLPRGRGSAVHWVAKEAHKRQMADGGRWSHLLAPPVFVNSPGTEEAVAEAADLAATALDRELQGEVMLTGEELQLGAARAYGQVKDHVVASSKFYVRTVAPKFYPLNVEHRVEVRPRQMSLVYHGQYDLVTLGRNGGRVVRDLKTGTRAPRANAADMSQQLDMYALLHSAEHGSLPESMALDYVVRDRRGIVSHHALETTRSPEDLEAMVLKLGRAVDAVRKGVFLPANPQFDWWCSPRWCGFWSTCPFVGSKGKR